MTEYAFEYDDYGDDLKQFAWEMFLEGYDLGKNVETLGRWRMKAARARFERYWITNHE